jgi:hypothetical protein
MTDPNYQAIQRIKAICRASKSKREAQALVEAEFGKLGFLEHFRPFMDIEADESPN